MRLTASAGSSSSIKKRNVIPGEGVMLRISDLVRVVWVRNWLSRRAFQSSSRYPASSGRSFTLVALGRMLIETVAVSEGEREREARIQSGIPTVPCAAENSRTPTCVKRSFLGLDMRNVNG
jgi:hypothetical protein